MPTQIYLIRHGVATWPSWPGADADRPLTAEGVRRMESAAAGLARRRLIPDLVLHSPLLRARMTAEILATQLGRLDGLRAHPALAPGFDADRLQDLLIEHADAGAIMCVAHNPDLGEIVMRLSRQPVMFKEGTLAVLARKTSDRFKLAWYATAEDLASDIPL
ncbi:MAG TPA: phosphohistidine phosphatase SixA [Anaerolineales bacterium]|nr:phosphohistidine phosphatase SixA [Anaerolineales bacterium]HRF49429.1 phosphohistidine phosphatase SixA [Anaerolineales bacterium]